MKFFRADSLRKTLGWLLLFPLLCKTGNSEIILRIYFKQLLICSKQLDTVRLFWKPTLIRIKRFLSPSNLLQKLKLILKPLRLLGHENNKTHFKGSVAFSAICDRIKSKWTVYIYFKSKRTSKSRLDHDFNFGIRCTVCSKDLLVLTDTCPSIL